MKIFIEISRSETDFSLGLTSTFFGLSAHVLAILLFMSNSTKEQAWGVKGVETLMRQYIHFARRRMELALKPEVRFVGPFLILIASSCLCAHRLPSTGREAFLVVLFDFYPNANICKIIS